MYYQNYEDYMRSVLGYPNDNFNPNTYYGCNDDVCNGMTQMATDIPEEREEWYPEIYRIVYPMVRKTCDDNINAQVTEELVEEMTNRIYMSIEVEEKEDMEPRQEELRNGDVRNPRAKEPERETRQRRPNNPILRDLIRILLLRELFDRRRRRPPFPGRPPRPPMPGPRPPFPPFPGGPGMRPPMPRSYDDLYY